MLKGSIKIRNTIPPPAEWDKATRQVVAEELEALSNSLVGRIRQNINAMGINTFGTLDKSWQIVSGTQTGEDITLRVESPQRYAAHVEFGTAGAQTKARRWPPLEPLILWVQKKLRFESRIRKTKAGTIVAYKRKRWGAGTIKGRSMEEQARILQIARAIQRKIYWRGTQPRYYMREALASLNLDAVAELDAKTQTMTYRVNVWRWLSERPIWEQITARARRGSKR